MKRLLKAGKPTMTESEIEFIFKKVDKTLTKKDGELEKNTSESVRSFCVLCDLCVFVGSVYVPILECSDLGEVETVKSIGKY